MSQSDQVSCHILICAYQSWGHHKTLLVFACRLVQERPDILVTFATAGEYTKLSKIERDNSFLQRDQTHKTNIRFIHLGGEGMSTLDLDPHILQNFPSLCKTLISPQREPIESFDGSLYANPRKPDMFICDTLWPELYEIFRAVPENTAPVLTWISPATAGTLYLVGPEELHGPGDVPAKAKALSLENGRPPSEIELELYRPVGNVFHMFGGIDIYDYEAYPQGEYVGPFFPIMVNLRNRSHRTFMDTDGLIFASNAVVEPDVHEACIKWCSERGKPCYIVGPFVLEENQLEAMQHQIKEFNNEPFAGLQNFLDKIYASHGPRSVLLLSFGTIYVPNSEAFLLVLKVILEMKIPIVLTHEPTRHGEIPPELRAELDASGIVYISNWTPQELILRHKVTGWFLTHCGWGSISEAITHAVPMIAWSILAEQPYNAAYCTLKLDIAYELVEVRSGAGLRPLYRGVTPTGTAEAVMEEARTVLKNAFGEDGKRKRQNIEQLSRRMNVLWKEGGESVGEMRRFIADYVPSKEGWNV